MFGEDYEWCCLSFGEAIFGLGVVDVFGMGSTDWAPRTGLERERQPRSLQWCACVLASLSGVSPS